MSEDKQEFTVKGVSGGDVQAAAQQAWAEMQVSGSSAQARAQAAGIDVSKLPANLSAVLSMRVSAGVGTIETLLLGALGPMAWDIWKHVLLPQIREKWGDESIKAKKAAAKTAAKTAAKSAAAKPAQK